MAFGYPVLLELAGRRVVEVGELAVEAGKVEGLLAAGAEVTVVAKGPEATLARLEADPRVVVHRRGYRGPGDLAGAVLCVAHAAEPGVRNAIAADARAAGILVNVMDDVPNCDFAAPAIVRRGDLVVYDGLARAALLDLAPRGAGRVDAGKARRRAALSQEAINAVLVDRGRRGLTVVRLKGGDPFVFGRGGEEALALAAAGVRFEIVPGVSAAVAAPAYAGIPVTHRGLATAFVVVSG